MKTGFICDSGFNMVASATRDGHKLIAVVLGEATGGERAARAANLLEHGFQTYKWKEVLGAPTLDKLAVADDPKGPVTMRNAVISFACGTGGRRAVAKRKRHKMVAEKKASTRKPARQRAAAAKASQ
jgi:D-alanyl-D-alanine carboxypeptidase